MTSAECPHTSSRITWLKGEWSELNFRKAEFSLPDDENGVGSRNIGLLYNWLEWSLQARMEVVWLQWEVYSGRHPHQRELGVVELRRSEKGGKQAVVASHGKEMQKTWE